MRSPSFLNAHTRRYHGKRFLRLLAVFIALPNLSWSSPPPTPGGRFYVNYAASVNAEELERYDLSIIAPASRVDPRLAHKAGKRVLAYISVGELGNDSPLREDAIRHHVLFLAKNPVWQSDLVDVSRPEWARFLMDEAAKNYAPYDGFFLDTVDSIDALSQRFPKRKAEFRTGMVRLIRAFKERFPDKQIFINRGFTVFDDVRDVINGFVVESLYQTYNFGTGHYEAVAPAETGVLLRRLRKVAAAGIPVYVLDYVDPGNPALARETANRIQRLGYNAFISTPKLQGVDLTPCVASPPLGEQSRHVLVLYGNEMLDKHPIVTPQQSFVCQLVQTPLEWLGYETDYLDVLQEKLPDSLPPGTAAVIVDGFLHLRPELEEPVAVWLLAQRQKGVRLLILDTIPFHDERVRERFLAALNIGGGGRSDRQPLRLHFTTISSAMNFEAPLRLFPDNLVELEEPPGAVPLLSMAAQDKLKRPIISDAIFAASWGGVALAPYILFQREDLLDLWIVDPFAFLTAALRPPDWPMPDPTTRDGLRIFYSHIDGDGFSDMSAVKLGHRSAEVIRDEILAKYPLPITASVIESEVSGKLQDQAPGEGQALEDIARSIFALPNVQVASHTFTHPFYWMKEPPEPEELIADGITGWNLKLADPASYPKLDFHREIVDSVNYIRTRLTTKPVDLLLWSGDCLPPPEAIGVCKEAGVLNMNGGDTTISRHNPSLTCVAPRSLFWGGQLQIYAANQNEEVYTNDWKGPIFGTFSLVTDTFERTEAPRRLKPVNIYIHFFSGDRYDALEGARAAYNWVIEHPLHSVTALTYARIVADARATRVIYDGPNRWRLINNGDCRTFRLADANLHPNIAASHGVTGYNTANGSVYIHTDGLPETRLVLSETPEDHLYLVSSTAEIKFSEFSKTRLAFEARDLRPVTVVIGGAPAKAIATVAITGAAPANSTQIADAQGRFTLTLPDRATVSLELAHADTARR